jgi:DNA repair photolyase
MGILADAGVPTRLFIMPVLPLITDGEAGLRALLGAARAHGAGEAICQALFLRTPMTWTFFLRFIEQEFPWALPRYRELYPRPDSAPREYRDAVERRVERLAREAGFTARSRDERGRDEAPARPRQLSHVW